MLAYREQPVMEHRPEKHQWVLQSVRVTVKRCVRRKLLFTWQYEHDPSQASEFRFGLIWASNLGTLHSKESEDGAEKAQADRGDHQSSARLDIACNQSMSFTWTKDAQLSREKTSLCDVTRVGCYTVLGGCTMGVTPWVKIYCLNSWGKAGERGKPANLRQGPVLCHALWGSFYAEALPRSLS